MKFIFVIFIIYETISAETYDISIPENDTANYNYAEYRIWLNDSIDTLRGIYWFMHANNGDSRNVIYDTLYQNLASNKQFALMGARIFNMHMSSGVGDATIAATDSFAILSNHQELLNIPFFINGYSWGGQFAYHFTKWIPERVLGFITQKGGFHDTSISDIAIQVPGLMFIGENDLDYRIENLTNIFLNHRPLGARWALAVEPNTGHSQINDFELLNSYFNTIVDFRIPNNANFYSSVILNNLPDSLGWFGNQNSWIIGSWACYNDNRDSSSWLPLRSNAELWQDFVSENSVVDTSDCIQDIDSSYVLFTVGIHGEDETSDYVIATNDTNKINLCRSQLELNIDERLFHVNGYIDSTNGGFNNPWNWHIIPNEWVLAEMSIGLCNGTPQQVENDLDYWLNSVGQLCNWNSFIKSEILTDSLCNENEIKLWNECYNIQGTDSLDLSLNNFSDSIPQEICNLVNLRYLNLSQNNLTGVIPPEIGNLMNLEVLNLSQNNLTGVIPPEIGNLLNLKSLHLQENQLIEEIPDEIGNLDSLNLLFLYQNQLSGQIPEGICNLSFDFSSFNSQFNISNNQLCPPYPTCIGSSLGIQDTTNCDPLSVINQNMPISYKLYKAYPNPFNPSTTISIDVGNEKLRSLNIYNLNGKLIERFSIEYYVSGHHQILWRPINLSSGIYFIEMVAKDFRSTQKLILLN